MKRAFDLIAAVLLSFVLLPVIGLVSFLVYIKLGRPVFFVQERTGLKDRTFRLIKFRSMFVADESGKDDKDRLTPFGRWLRSTSLDELPELWNVLKGEMSLVGPRPLLPQYLPLYSARQARRHEVRPGVTGWAQINGRNALTWKEKFELDVWYVDNRTFWLDLKILLITLYKVVRREGISAESEATMPYFTGDN